MIDSSRLEHNKKMIGKTVKVIEKDGLSWVGEVKDADEDSFDVSNGYGDVVSVSIFDIRTP
tara:strand:- start:296 stop:478 length:183 start_codon:yes stop_codon:yes gene_type:complete